MTANSKPLIYAKMAAVMKDIGAVGKDQKNTVQGFKFRGIDQFVNALHPALTKHGVFMTTEVLSYTDKLQEVTRSSGKAGIDKHVSITMKYTFHAEDGSSVFSSVPAEGLDSGDKATNKALSAALKYTLIQTFIVPTEDMAEGDLDSPEIGIPQKSNGKAASVTTTAATTETTEDVAPASAVKAPAAKSNGSNGKKPAPFKRAATKAVVEDSWE